MEKSIIVFTVVSFLLFTISTALDHDITLPTLPTLPTRHEPKTIPTQSVPESETTQLFDLKTTINPPLRSRIINNRNFYENTRIPLRFVRKHPCKNKYKKMFMIHDDDHQKNYKSNNMRVVSYANDMVLSDLTTNFDGRKYPTERFEFKHKYGHGHHHHHENEEMKKKERKGGFMRGIRMFLKHTFD